METYKKTHPWIKFEFDVKCIPSNLWILLGEAQSKCNHISGVPLKPITAKNLHRLYLAKGALGTTAIEGNTLSEKEVLQQIDGVLELPPSRQYLGREIQNILNACELITDNLQKGAPTDISLEEINHYNEMVLSKLPLNESVVPGKIRTHSVGVEGVRYKGAPAKDCEYLLTHLCEWLNTDFQIEEDNYPIVFALFKAIIAHVYLAWIHPYGDGNGRTARLVEFKILLASGVPTPAAHLLSNFYNETRQEYYRQLAHISRTKGDIIPFIEYAVSGFTDGLKIQLGIIREQQWDIAWRNYIHETFADKNKKSDIRRRHLALDISRESKAVSLSKLNMVSPRVAGHYAKLNMGERALYSDVRELIEMKLLIETKNGIIANRETILSFLPFRKKPSVQSELPLDR